MQKRVVFLLFFSITLITNTLKSQVVWENPNGEIHNYLYRMAQKGLIHFDDYIRPVSRIYIEQCLDSLQNKSFVLSNLEKKELDFYRREFTDLRIINTPHPDPKTGLFSNDNFRRFRAIATTADNFLIRVDPNLSASTLQGGGRNIKQTSSGFNMYGYIGKHWSFYSSVNDINENGVGLDTQRQFTPTPGIVTKIASNGKSQNFSELRGGITYSWKNGSVSFCQDQLLNGYGENGRIILSSKSPSYPYLRLDYSPFNWLSFNYSHAWLNSTILDTATSYSTGTGIYGGRRDLYIPKFMAQHSLRFSPHKGWDIVLGESLIYTDKINVGYLVPVLFFKMYDNLINNNNINAGSNGQLFLQVSSRNNLPKTHFYSSLFIDEIRVASIFNRSKSRNQIGYTIGASVTDLGLPYLTLGLEYTHINPFVYRNLLPAQNYTNSGYSLGDWMGSNADRLIASLKYTPAPRVKCMLRYQYMRKGAAGTIDQQYFQQPQPDFLFGLQTKQQEWHLQCSFEWLPKLYLMGYVNSLHINNFQPIATFIEKTYSLGMSYGF